MHRNASQLISKTTNKISNGGRFSTSKSRLLLTTALVGGLSVGITTAFAGDPIFIESENSVTHNNTAAIDATGPEVSAINIESEENATVVNSGALNSSDGMGMWIAAGGTTDVSNNAEITSKEEAINLFGFSSVKLSNEGDLSNTRLNGISVISFGDTTVENSGSINASEGIKVFSTAGAAAISSFGLNNTSSSDGGNVTIENEGNITLTEGSNQNVVTSKDITVNHERIGISGLTTNGLTLSDQNVSDEISIPLDTSPDSLDVTITNTGDIADASAIDGPTSVSIGIGAVALGDVSLDNDGDISVGEKGIVAFAGGEISATNTGDITLSNGDDSGIILSTFKIFPDNDGGNITLNNSGKITAENSDEGIDVESRGTAIVTNSGAIKGGNNTGIEVEAAGAVSLTNSGKIETTGYNADGLATSSETSDTVINSGEIIASDAGIRAGGFGFTTVTNQKDGNIHGGNVGISSGSGNAATIVNAGKIEVDEIGINAIANGGSFEEDDGDGNVTTVSVLGGEIKVTNSGSITMVQPDSSEDDAYELDGHTLATPKNVAILAVSKNGGAKIEYSINEFNENVVDRDELKALADSAANNTVTIINSGTIDGTASNWSHGIYAMASDGVNIDNSGDITVANEAIYVIGHSPVSIKNSGNIKVSGTVSAAVVANSRQGSDGPLGETVSVENSGKIEAIGNGTSGIRINAEISGTVINSGEIVASYTGIDAGGHGNFVVTNQDTGNIHGARVGISSSNGAGTQITNAGKVDAEEIGIEAITFGGPGTITEGDGSSFDVNVPGGKVDVTNSGTITMITPSTWRSDNYELDGHSMDVPYNVGILAVSMNGGTHTNPYTDDFGRQLQNVKEFTAAADDAANNAVSVTNSGTIDGTASNWSHGIYAMASDGVNIDNSGDILVGATAIYVTGNSAISIENSGTIRVNGEFGRHAVDLLSGNSDDATKGEAISVKNSGTIDLTDAGKGRRAVQAWSNGGEVTISNSGMVTTTAEDARGLQAASGTPSRCNFDENNNCVRTTAVDGGVVSVNSSGSVSTAGESSDAIYTVSSNGAVNIDTSGTISTSGKDSKGIQANSGNIGGGSRKNIAQIGGAITIDNSAIIGTKGELANGISAFSNGGTVDVTNAGEITTAGKSARGIDLSSGNSQISDDGIASAGGKVTLTNEVNGDISTTGDKAAAIQAGSSNGNISVINHAELSTGGYKSAGITSYTGNNRENDSAVVFKGGNISIVNSGEIATNGNESNGIGAWSNGGQVNIENSGSISTTSLDSNGIGAYSGTSYTADNRVIQTGSNLTVLNSGTITTDKKDSYGIDSYSYGGAIQITLNASSAITTKGEAAMGVSAYSGNSKTKNSGVIKDGGSVMADLNGTISTSGAGANGVNLDSYGGAVALTNDAKITVSGAQSHGVVIGSGSLGTDGSVARDGGKITVTNTADIIASGTDGNGFVAYTPNNVVVLNNSAVISASNGKAIVANNATANVTNSGSLIGGASLGDNNDTLANSGKLEGKFDFGAGNDALHLEAGSIFKDATFDGGDGTDTVYLGGGGTLVNTSDNPFNDFEEGTIKAGSWKISGDLQWFDTFNAASGSVLDLNGGELKSNKINLLSGSVLKGSGTLSGGVTNNGSILLASTDTLKIKGDFYSGNSSKIEFALGGGDGSTHSKLEVTGGKFTFASSAVLNIAVDANTDLAKNSRYKIATADGGVDDLSTSNDKTAVKINDSSAAFRFERTIEGNSVWITAKAAIYDVVATLAPSLAKQASAVEEFVVESGSGGVLAEQLNGLNETQLVTAVAELTTPNEAAGHNSLNSTVSTVNNIVDNRIAGRISGSSQRNFYTGNSTDDPNTQNAYRANAGQTEASEVVMAYGGEGIVGSRWLDEGGYSQAWAQAFWGNSTIEKSESNQYGTSVGLDFRPDQNTLIGGSFSYSRTNADATNSSLEADTYGGMLYGAKGFDSGLAFSGVIGYFLSQNESKRLAFGSIYSGDFDSNTFTLSGNVSQEIDLQQDWLFTPNAGVRYSHATFDDYKETGGVAPLTISRSDVDSIELSAEASFTRNFNVTEATKGLFELHFGGLYEVGDNDSTVAYRFSPTGTMLYDSSEVARLKFNVGTLVEIPFSDQISSEFAYEGTFADDYADHLLRAKFKVKF